METEAASLYIFEWILQDGQGETYSVTFWDVERSEGINELNYFVCIALCQCDTFEYVTSAWQRNWE